MGHGLAAKIHSENEKLQAEVLATTEQHPATITVRREAEVLQKEEINLELNNRSFVTQTEVNDILLRLAHLESFY